MSELQIPRCSFSSPPPCHIFLVVVLQSIEIRFTLSSLFLSSQQQPFLFPNTSKIETYPLWVFHLLTSRYFICGTSYNVTPPFPSCWPLRLDVCNEDEQYRQLRAPQRRTCLYLQNPSTFPTLLIHMSPDIRQNYMGRDRIYIQ